MEAYTIFIFSEKGEYCLLNSLHFIAFRYAHFKVGKIDSFVNLYLILNIQKRQNYLGYRPCDTRGSGQFIKDYTQTSENKLSSARTWSVKSSLDGVKKYIGN